MMAVTLVNDSCHFCSCLMVNSIVPAFNLSKLRTKYLKPKINNLVSLMVSLTACQHHE